MFGTNRQDKIFNMVRSAVYPSVSMLSSKFKISERSIRSDIAGINAVLASHGARIAAKRGAGYYLKTVDDEQFRSFMQSRRSKNGQSLLGTAADRIRLVLGTLLVSEEYVSKQELSSTVFVDESTLENYLRSIRKVADRFGLEYVVRRGRGAKIIGSERNIRQCFVNEAVPHDYQTYIMGFTPSEVALFGNIDLKGITEKITCSLGQHNIGATDYGLKNLLLHVALMVSRVSNGCYVEREVEPRDFPPMVHEFVNDICKDLSDRYCLHIQDTERSYLAQHVMFDTDAGRSGSDTDRFMLHVDQMLIYIKENYGYDLREDLLLRTNLTAHLSSLFQDRAAGIKHANPLLNIVKKNYPLAYEISIASLSQTFERDHVAFEDDEIGLIALHIGSAMERYASTLNDRCVAIVVCPLGRAATSMLTSRIESLFGNRLEIKMACSYQDWAHLEAEELRDIDLVISTVNLKTTSIPCALVEFNLPSQDVQTVSRLLKQTESRDLYRTRGIFDVCAFQIFKESINKDALLEQMCQNLITQNLATEGLYQSVMEREALSDTAMGSAFAIPHPMMAHTDRTRIAVAICRTPVHWSEEGCAVQIVFLLMTPPGDPVELERMYDLLVRVMNDQKLQQKIVRSSSFSEFVELFDC